MKRVSSVHKECLVLNSIKNRLCYGFFENQRTYAVEAIVGGASLTDEKSPRIIKRFPILSKDTYSSQFNKNRANC